MAKQRLVVWSLNRLLSEDKDEAVIIDLDYESLLKSHPKLARAIGRGRITSHAIINYGVIGVTPIITFVVDHD